MEPLVKHKIRCPYCGESNILLLDRTEVERDLVEDCQICCRPMEIRLSFGVDGEMILDVTREDE